MGTRKKYKQGIYTPIHQEKYKGSLPCIYRSGLELKVMQWLDSNSRVIKWGSESVVIPYLHPSDNRMHRYFVDFNFTIQRNDGIKKYLVEVKPSSQCRPPKKRKNSSTFLRESVTYTINQCKWQAATAWAGSHGYEFVIFTEKHLK